MNITWLRRLRRYLPLHWKFDAYKGRYFAWGVSCRGRGVVKIQEYTRVYAGAYFEADRAWSSIIVGKHCMICRGAMLMAYGGHITIGDHSTVNPYCVLYGHGGLTIGNGVRIAAHTVIVPANHGYQDKETPIYQQPITAKGIVIEDDVWVGCGVRILDGVRIGKGSVIAAGAVVTKDIAPNSVVGGVPARLIKSR